MAQLKCKSVIETAPMHPVESYDSPSTTESSASDHDFTIDKTPHVAIDDGSASISSSDISPIAEIDTVIPTAIDADIPPVIAQAPAHSVQKVKYKKKYIKQYKYKYHVPSYKPVKYSVPSNFNCH